MNTKLFVDEFKGFKVLAVWEVDDNGLKKGDYPIISLRRKKLRAVVDHVEEIKDELRNW